MAYITCSLLEQFRQMVKKHLSQDLGVNKTYRRNARLALVHFQTSFNPKGESFVKTVMGFPYRWQQYIIHQAKGDGTLPQQLVKVVDTGVSDRVCFLLEYLIEYCHFSGVVGDIEPYFKQLSADEKAIVLKHAKLIMVDGRALVFIEPGDEFVLGESTPIAPAVVSAHIGSV